jgi:dsDNA-specific endonuclease/ATPase MutS2
MYSVVRFSLDPSLYRRPFFVISDSEMARLKVRQYQEELDSVVDQRKRLEDAYDKQRHHLLEREKSIKSELKALAPSASNPVKETVEKAVDAIKDTAKKVVAKDLAN